MNAINRINFIKEYINKWSEFDGCSAFENGFKCWGCTALFVEDGFNIHFGFYNPSGKKLGEYTLNAETGVAIMIYNERYVEGGNDHTGLLADILGGLLGGDEFGLINEPVIIYEDAPEQMSIEDIWKEIVSSICGEVGNYPTKYDERTSEQ